MRYWRSDWLRRAKSLAYLEGVREQFVPILDAFGPRQASDEKESWRSESYGGRESENHVDEEWFASLKSWVEAMELEVEPLQMAIVDTLQEEVDAEQASMFARRFVSVVNLLQGLGRQEVDGLWLCLGLLCRVHEILNAPLPRVLRVRAICDFYYSQAAILSHQKQNQDGQQPRSLEEAVACFVWREIVPGVRLGRLETIAEAGPLFLHVLEVQPSLQRRIQAVDCRELKGYEEGFGEVVRRRGAVAGVSGGFFLYSESDIEPPSRRTDPVGLLVHEGLVLNPPIFERASLLLARDGSCAIRPLGMKGVTISWRSSSEGCVKSVDLEVLVEAVQEEEAIGKKVVVFHRAGQREIGEHVCPSLVLVGREVTAVGVGLQNVPLAGALVLFPEAWQGELPEVGSDVSFALPHALGDIVNGMAGGPILLRDGEVSIALEGEDFQGSAPPVTFSQDETFDQNLLPRMGAGLRLDGTLLFAAVDGRNFERAPGMTLHQVARLLKALGCHDAMNLDGGSSKRMVVEGEVVDLSSTEVVFSARKPQRVRPVNSGFLLFVEEE